MQKNPIVWFVIADGARARILSYRTADGVFERVTDLASATAHLSSKDLGSDKPGRAFESVGRTRHAIEEKSDFHEKGEVEFAGTIAQGINEAATKGEFQLLGLVAQPRFIHAIKSSLRKEAAAKLFAEMPKDLTKLPEGELRERLLSLRIPHGTR